MAQVKRSISIAPIRISVLIIFCRFGGIDRLLYQWPVCGLLGQSIDVHVLLASNAPNAMRESV
jgi:hypothetical protein